MLIDMMTGKQITQVPYAKGYQTFMSRMTAAEIAAIRHALDAMVQGTEIQTAGWMPGADWTGTPFQPIYEKAAHYDEGAAARCFGLMVWEVFMQRPEVWTSGRFEKDGEEIGSRTFFQPRNRP